MKKNNHFLFIRYLIVLIMGMPQLSCAQNQLSTDSVKFIILSSKYDGKNMTKFDVERGGAILFEFEGKALTQMSNISEVDNCKSFGEVSNYKSDTTYLSDRTYKLVNTSFSWNYKNDYDSATGMALVKFKEKETAYGTNFVLQMLIEKTSEIIEYSGYKYGTRDPFVLTENIWK
jgi:hypothetical protein